MTSGQSSCHLLDEREPPVVRGGWRHDINNVPTKQKFATTVKRPILRQARNEVSGPLLRDRGHPAQFSQPGSPVCIGRRGANLSNFSFGNGTFGIPKRENVRIHHP